jgi:hypothetical protein
VAGATRFDAAVARRWLALSLEGIERDREAIDSLNVYPVPDGDTGTNLHLTLVRAAQEVRGLPDDANLAAIAGAAAHGALLGARGNSGIITSQLLRGWAEALDGVEQAGPEHLAEALRRADEQAWLAVETPVEGTILSVTRAAALAAAGRDDLGLDGLVRVAAEAARAALRRTTSQLDVLAEAGVVDAGGAGIVVVLDALVAAVTGERAAPPPVAAPGPVPVAPSCPSPGDGGPSHEVMFLLDLPPAEEADRVAVLRAALAGLGDSLVVVGGSGLWHVHVHVDDHAAALAEAGRAGTPREVRVTHLVSGQVVAGVPAATVVPSQPSVPATPSAGLVDEVAVVACASGPGLAALFAQAGAVVVGPGPGARPSTEELLAAVRSTGAACVVLLPNDTDTVAVARAAAEAAAADGIRVEVVPTRAQVQGLAALAVHDATLDLAACAARVSAAAGATRDGAVTTAAREAVTRAGRCRPGDVLGVVAGTVEVVGSDVTAVAGEVLDLLLAHGGELVTVVLGEQAPAGLAAAVDARLGGRGVEVHVVEGGQPRYPVLLGVE